MTELFFMYWPGVLAATFSAAALAVLGAWLVTRQLAVQTLALGQGASLGLLAGLVVVSLGVHDDHLEHTVWPLLLGFVGAAAAAATSARAARGAAGKAGVFVAAFALYWAGTQLLTGFFPSVASHASSLYFGDIVTLGRSQAFFFASLGAFSLVLFAINWRSFSDRSFLLSLQDEPPVGFHAGDALFHLVTLLLVSLSIELLGLLFTLASLFLPTVILVRGARPGVGRHLLLAGISAALAAAAGFLLSLAEPRLLTSPTIALLLALVPGAAALLARLFRGGER